MSSIAPSPLAQQIATFALKQRADGIPQHIRTDVVSRIVDLLGNAIAARPSDVAAIMANVIQVQSGIDQSVAIGLPGRYPCANAALYNGTLAHCLDFDDTHLPSIVHPSASVIPAALAVSESIDTSSTSLLIASAVGIEITNRLGMAGYDPELRNSIFFERGLHATSICGALGAAAAAALLLSDDSDVISHAIAIAASMGAGLLEANRTGGNVKRIHCGWAAHAGVMAATFAQNGLTGPRTVLEGRFGFLQAHCVDQFDSTQVNNELGTKWTLPDTAFKPYPCNIYTHPGIDAALYLRSKGVSPDDIDSITIGVAPPTLRTIAEPAPLKAAPKTGYESLFSGPYTFAAAMCGGSGLGVYLDDFTDEAVKNSARLDVARRVSFVGNKVCAEAFPECIPAIVDVRCHDGQAFHVPIMSNRGVGDRRLSTSEVLSKFKLNAKQTYSDDYIGILLATISELESIPVRHLMDAVSGDD